MKKKVTNESEREQRSGLARQTYEEFCDVRRACLKSSLEIVPNLTERELIERELAGIEAVRRS